MNRIVLIFGLLIVHAVAYSQCLDGDCINGFGILQKNGIMYYSFFKDGKFDKATIEVKKSGIRAFRSENGKQMGTEVVINKAGTMHIQQYENGVRSGYGMNGKPASRNQLFAYMYTNGKRGRSLHDRLHSGKDTGLRCSGNCRDGLGRKIIGEGTYAEIGIFQKKKLQPIGIQTWPGSSEGYYGDLTKGDRNGFGFYKWDNGDIYVGEWDYGRRTGYGIKIAKGKVFAGIYKKNKLVESSFEGKYR